jgi:hypothetical protein
MLTCSCGLSDTSFGTAPGNNLTSSKLIFLIEENELGVHLKAGDSLLYLLIYIRDIGCSYASHGFIENGQQI